MRHSEPARPWLTALSLAGASTLLFPLLSGYSWYLVLLLIIGSITGVHWALRRLSAPDLVATLAGVAVLLCLLTAVAARGVATFGFWPGPAALTELRRVARTGLADAAASTSPAPATLGLVLLVALAVGSLTILAHALDEFDDLLGLGWPSLLMYASAAAILRHPVPWQWFAVAAGSWLMLLAGREAHRLQRFGPVAVQSQELFGAGTETPSRLGARAGAAVRTGATARRAGAAALAVSLVVPLLLPAGNRLSFGGRGNGPGGIGPGLGLVSIDPTVSLRRDLVSSDNRIVLTYRGVYANGAAADPTYLRLDVLDDFDGITWSAVPPDYTAGISTDQTWPTPLGLGRNVSLTGPVYTITVGPLDGRALPVPALTGAVTVSGIWFYDVATQTVRSIKDSPAGKAYTVRTWNSTPSPAQLRAAPPPYAGEAIADLQVPTDIPASVIQLAHQVTANAHTEYDAAIAIQAWLRTFRYSTSVQSGDGTSALLTFLRDRVGYCQQFAATMALFARVLGIPARVAVGFAPGSPRADGTYQVTVHDAHAWPELFFHGLGWVRFEPTPRDPSATGIAPPTFAGPPAPPGSTSGPGAQPNGAGKDKVLNRADGGSTIGSVSAPPVTAKRSSGSGAWAWLAGLAALLLVPLARRARRRIVLGRLYTGSELSWALLRCAAADLGAPVPVTLTPRQAGDLLASLSPHDVRPSIDRIVAGLEHSRYARTHEVIDLSAESRRVRRALRRRASVTARFRALALPGVRA